MLARRRIRTAPAIAQPLRCACTRLTAGSQTVIALPQASQSSSLAGMMNFLTKKGATGAAIAAGAPSAISAVTTAAITAAFGGGNGWRTGFGLNNLVWLVVNPQLRPGRPLRPLHRDKRISIKAVF